MYKITVFPGDGIGKEVTEQALKVLRKVGQKFHLVFETTQGIIGGGSIDKYGIPLTPETLDLAKNADAVFLGAVGGPKWDNVESSKRPEKALLGLRKGLDVFANLRPVHMFDELAHNSSLKPEIVKGLDMLILRELVSGIYFGTPRGVIKTDSGEEAGINTEFYSVSQVKRIAEKAFEFARKRRKKVTSVDKANVLESSQLWRKVVIETHKNYPDVQLDHRYVDDCAMQLVRNPGQFDVIVTTNLFGDILSDEAAMLTGSIGMLPSASLDEQGKGMYEPIHGSAPDIAGKDLANPIATVLSLAMALRYTLGEPGLAARVEQAVGRVLDQGLRTADIMSDGMQRLGTEAMGDAIVAAL